MATEYDQKLGTYAQWADGFSRTSLRQALKDQVLIQQGRLNNGNDDGRTTPSGRTREEYDALRSSRDDLDYREWNEDTGFSGVTRRPQGPGMAANGVRSESEKLRQARREKLDEGF